MLALPSGFRYQPSYAGVIPWPESCGGSIGVCVVTWPNAAPMSTNAAVSVRVMLIGAAQPERQPGFLRPVLGSPLGVIVIADVGHVDPRMRHLIHGPVAPADPLVRVRIRRLCHRIVVPRLHVNH